MTTKQSAATYASRYINSTQRHVFLTGKAGTGKTTFLKEIVSNTHKNTIVAAPTGIAAINAGGVTLHSLFQLPFGSFLPSNTSLSSGDYNTQINTPNSLMKAIKLNTHKRKLLQELELLIIDEVSMMRADLLDAIDHVLKTVRRKRSESFGGVQLLLIGDMLQLPPVVKQHEWEYLKSFYASPFFFHAKSLENHPPVYLELEKIYRQQDQEFVNLLNNLRDNKLTADDMKLLNKYYQPKLSEKEKKGAVSLTTHNKQADEINRSMLNSLPGKSFHYKADVSGDFNEYLYPVEHDLELKEGAQIMFIKNDYSGQQRYFNGKIGEIDELSEDSIWVRFPDTGECFEIEHYTWENKRYTLNKEIGEIEEKEIGKFQHYPIKLAWAITVHKSQGLTFDKAIIDVSRAFAPGQAYVALSRLRSLKGLILTSTLPQHGLKIDNTLSEFSKRKQDLNELSENIKTESFRYLKHFLADCFDFVELKYAIDDHILTYDKDEKRSAKQKHKAWAVGLKEDILPIIETGKKFLSQLHKLTISESNCDTDRLEERVKAASDYFSPLLKKLTDKVNNQIDSLGSARGLKKYITELKALDGIFLKRLKRLMRASIFVQAYKEGEEPDLDFIRQSRDLIDLPAKLKQKTKAKPKKKTVKKEEKPPKKPTFEISFELYQELKDVEKVAAERGFSPSTIYSHLAQCVAKNMIPVTEFISESKMELIIQAQKAVDSHKLGDIKAVLGDEFSYEDIRFAMAGYFSEPKE